MILFVLKYFSNDLKRLGLYEAVRATCYGIEVSVPNFYALFKLYCPSSGTFFAPVDELGLTLHDMWEVSNLPIGFLPYEEYFSCPAELEQLGTQDPTLF